MSGGRADQLRQRLAREAARLMVEEGVSEYFDAKRIAARRVLGAQQGRKALRYRPGDLPSNGEIQAAVRALSDLVEGPERQERLFVMRALALEIMEALEPFDPRLIGSVSTGHARRGSDIDLHVFTDDVEALERHLRGLGWAYDLKTVTIHQSHQLRDYLHIYLRDTAFPVELSVYTWRERRVTSSSSTDGQPIVRLKPEALAQRMAQEHPDLWEDWRQRGLLPDLEALLEEGPPQTLADLEGW